MNFSSEIDYITIDIELCNIPHISGHCPKNVSSLFKVQILDYQKETSYLF